MADTALIQDSFTDVDGTNIENHAPEIGGAWSASFNDFKIYSNRCRAQALALQSTVNSTQSVTTPDIVYIQSKVYLAALGRVYMQINDDVNGGSAGVVRIYTNKIELYGPLNISELNPYTPVSGATYRLEKNGTTYTLYENGVSILTETAYDGASYAAFNFTMSVSGTEIDDFEAGEFTPPPPITITTTTLPAGLIDQFYGASLSATGDTSYTYALTAGTLPPGVVLATNQISGYPTIKGLFPITITATGIGGATDTQDYVISIGDKFNANAGDMLAKVAILNTGDDADLEQQIQNITTNDYGVNHKVVDVNFNAVGGYAQVDAGFKVNKWEIVDKKNVPAGTYLEVKQTAVDNRYLTLQSVGALGTIKLHLWG